VRAKAAGDAVQATVQEIIDACLSMAGLPYDGEPVDQLSHALQCAALALREAPSDDEFVIACLLHDIARAPAVADMPYDRPLRRLPGAGDGGATDAPPAGAGEPAEHHGEAAARWLAPRVGARVARLACQHVDAKRYLVATDPAYRARLSAVSLRTLESQGGAMGDREVARFRQRDEWELAVSLRLIDDRGKVVGLQVPGIETHRERLARVVAAAHGAAAGPC